MGRPPSNDLTGYVHRLHAILKTGYARQPPKKKTTAEAVVSAIYRPLKDQFFLPSYGAPPPIVGDTLVLPIVEGALPFSVWLLAGLTGVVLTGPGVVLRVAAGAGVPTGTDVFGGVAPESFGVVEGDVA